MIRYKQALAMSPSDFKRAYGVSQEVFQKMIEVVLEAKVGKRGCHSKLSIPQQILLTLQYLREYRTFFHLAQDWGVHESTAYRIIRRIEDILVKADRQIADFQSRQSAGRLHSAAEEFRLPSQRQLQKSETEIEVIVVDVAETEIERPKKNREATIAEKKELIHLKHN